jgi:hypothetical protein
LLDAMLLSVARGKHCGECLFVFLDFADDVEPDALERPEGFVVEVRVHLLVRAAARFREAGPRHLVSTG